MLVRSLAETHKYRINISSCVLHSVLFIYFFCPGHLLESCALDKWLLAVLDPTNHIMNQKKKERKKEGEKSEAFFVIYISMSLGSYDFLCTASPRLPTNVDRPSLYIKKNTIARSFSNPDCEGISLSCQKPGGHQPTTTAAADNFFKSQKKRMKTKKNTLCLCLFCWFL